MTLGYPPYYAPTGIPIEPVNRSAFDMLRWEAAVQLFRKKGVEPFDVEVALVLSYIEKYKRDIGEEIDDLFPYILQRRVIGGE